MQKLRIWGKGDSPKSLSEGSHYRCSELFSLIDNFYNHNMYRFQKERNEPHFQAGQRGTEEQEPLPLSRHWFLKHLVRVRSAHEKQKSFSVFEEKNLIQGIS